MSKRPSGNKRLGKGGNSLSVERYSSFCAPPVIRNSARSAATSLSMSCRWQVTASGAVVAPKLVHIPHCVSKEVLALKLANGAGVPRVVQLLDEVPEPSKGTWLILEYVNRHHLSSKFALHPI